jgi:hypothetical protein
VCPSHYASSLKHNVRQEIHWPAWTLCSKWTWSNELSRKHHPHNPSQRNSSHLVQAFHLLVKAFVPFHTARCCHSLCLLCITGHKLRRSFHQLRRYSTATCCGINWTLPFWRVRNEKLHKCVYYFSHIYIPSTFLMNNLLNLTDRLAIITNQYQYLIHTATASLIGAVMYVHYDVSRLCIPTHPRIYSDLHLSQFVTDGKIRSWVISDVSRTSKMFYGT